MTLRPFVFCLPATFWLPPPLHHLSAAPAKVSLWLMTQDKTSLLAEPLPPRVDLRQPLLLMYVVDLPSVSRKSLGGVN
jgi:hypothetical protein